jgi:AcrR family transcriptional regulator
MQAPPTPRYQEKREAILAAAALSFNQQGVKAATLSGIAGSVNLVTNSVTYYYRKKEDLASACFLRSIEAFDELAVAAAAEADVPARLRAFFRLQAQLLADIEEGRRAPIVGFNDIRALPGPHAQTVFAAYTDMFRRVRSLLQGRETEPLARDDLNARAHMLLSIANGAHAWIGRYETADYARAADRVSDLLLHGLAGAGSTWQPTPGELGWHLADGTAAPPGAAASPDGAAAPGTASSAAFLRAATVLVNEHGYRGASVDKISARLNVTKGSFYHHHDNKHDLIAECFDRSFAVMRQALSLAEASPGTGWGRVCAAARVLVRFQLSHDGPLLRATATSALPDQQQRDRVRATLRRLAERMGHLVVDGMVDGSIRPLDPAIAANALIATINAAAELHRWVPGAHAGNVADLYVRPAFEGVSCPGVGATNSEGQSA